MYRNILRRSWPNYLKVSGCRSYETESVYGHKRRVKKSSFQISQQVVENRIKYSNFYRLATAYREHGHKVADINPVSFNKTDR